MKKTILFFALVFVSALVMGRTTAYFTDSVSAEGNRFVAGTLKIEIDEEGSDFYVEFENMAPGQRTEEKSLILENSGSLAMKITELTADYPEVDESHEYCTEGEKLKEMLKVYVKEGSYTLIDGESLDDLIHGVEFSTQNEIDPEETITYKFSFELDGGAGNGIQGCVLEEVNFLIKAEQVK